MFSADWFSQNIHNWEKWLGEFKGKESLNFLEVGCFEGRATLWLCENILTGRGCSISVVDTFEGGMEAGEKGAHFADNVMGNFCQNLINHNEKVHIFQGISQEVLRMNKSFYSSLYKFDFIYIDGSHRSPEVLEDTILTWRLLKSGGIMIFDDYGLKRYKNPLDNPAIGIDAFLEVFEGKYEVISKGYQLAIRKI